MTQFNTLVEEMKEEFDKEFPIEANGWGNMSYEDRLRLIAFITTTATRVREETEKAYGGCHYCYGKGYGTQTASWVGRGYYKKLPTMKFCTCERGKQLEELLSTLNK